jgi:hypothetical protein
MELLLSRYFGHIRADLLSTENLLKERFRKH